LSKRLNKREGPLTNHHGPKKKKKKEEKKERVRARNKTIEKEHNRTSFATPSSSLYPSFSKISWMAVKSLLIHASPNADRGNDDALCGIPIKI